MMASPISSVYIDGAAGQLRYTVRYPGEPYFDERGNRIVGHVATVTDADTNGRLSPAELNNAIVHARIDEHEYHHITYRSDAEGLEALRQGKRYVEQAIAQLDVPTQLQRISSALGQLEYNPQAMTAVTMPIVRKRNASSSAHTKQEPRCSETLAQTDFGRFRFEREAGSDYSYGLKMRPPHHDPLHEDPPLYIIRFNRLRCHSPRKQYDVGEATLINMSEDQFDDTVTLMQSALEALPWYPR